MIYFDGDYANQLKAKVEAAQKEIDVCMYVWRWYQNDPTLELQQVYIALLRAAAKGIRVRILTDFPEVAARMRMDGLDAVSVPPSKIMHAKMFIFDDREVALGSHNMTKRSTTKNHEATAVLTDFESVQQAKTYFNAIWSTYASSKAYQLDAARGV